MSQLDNVSKNKEVHMNPVFQIRILSGVGAHFGPIPPLGLTQESIELRAARRWSAAAGSVATLAVTNNATERRARLHISFGSLSDADGPWAARFWETLAPSGVEPIEWLLISDSPIRCTEDALHLLLADPGLVTALSCS
jgi:hypothetical protein